MLSIMISCFHGWIIICDDEVRSAETYRQEVGDLLNDIKVCKCHWDEALKIPGHYGNHQYKKADQEDSN